MVSQCKDVNFALRFIICDKIAKKLSHNPQCDRASTWLLKPGRLEPSSCFKLGHIKVTYVTKGIRHTFAPHDEPIRFVFADERDFLCIYFKPFFILRLPSRAVGLSLCSYSLW